jgi:hypothetical protein
LRSILSRSISTLPQAGLFVRVAALFLTVAAVVIRLATHDETPLFTRALWGVAGASLVLGGMAYPVMSKGAPFFRKFVSKPHFCPPIPVNGGVDPLVGGGGTAPRSKIA